MHIINRKALIGCAIGLRWSGLSPTAPLGKNIPAEHALTEKTRTEFLLPSIPKSGVLTKTAKMKMNGKIWKIIASGSIRPRQNTNSCLRSIKLTWEAVLHPPSVWVCQAEVLSSTANCNSLKSAPASNWLPWLWTNARDTAITPNALDWWMLSWAKSSVTSPIYCHNNQLACKPCNPCAILSHPLTLLRLS